MHNKSPDDDDDDDDDGSRLDNIKTNRIIMWIAPISRNVAISELNVYIHFPFAASLQLFQSLTTAINDTAHATAHNQLHVHGVYTIYNSIHVAASMKQMRFQETPGAYHQPNATKMTTVPHPLTDNRCGGL